MLEETNEEDDWEEDDDDVPLLLYQENPDDIPFIMENDDNYNNLNIVRYILGIHDSIMKIEDPDLDCSICLTQIKLGDNISKYEKCFHSFHVKCIEPWFIEKKIGAFCPKCRYWRLKEIFEQIKEEAEWDGMSIMEKVFLALKEKCK